MAYKVPILEFYEWQKPVKSINLTAPPETETLTKGFRYIIGFNPSGAWHNKPKRIGEWTGEGWEFTEPKNGMMVLVESENKLYQYTSNTWKDFALLVTGKKKVVSKNNEYNVTGDDTSQVIVYESQEAGTYQLPDLNNNLIGSQYTFIKKDTGTLTIKAAETNTIAESSPGGAIISSVSSQKYTSLSLLAISATEWVIVGAHGTWSVN